MISLTGPSHISCRSSTCGIVESEPPSYVKVCSVESSVINLGQCSVKMIYHLRY